MMSGPMRPPGLYIGFTGTQNGMTEAQRDRAREQTELYRTDLVETQRNQDTVYGVHGNCIGGDEEWDEICVDLGMRTFCLPCTIARKQSNKTKAAPLARPAPPLDRNKVIVLISIVLVAAPKTMDEELRSGTWSTVRHARKRGISIALCLPDGSVKHEGDYKFQ